jgi:16S rRNA (cytosine967-C5)-methyltransferase
MHYPQEALEILTHAADAGKTAIRVNLLRTTPTRLAEQLLAANAKSVEPGFVPGSLLVRFEGSPAENEAFKSGLYHVEGQASQLAALCVGAQPGDTVIDFCAAPGGKSVTIAQQMHNEGTLYSCDVTENRVSLIRTAVERMGCTCVQVRCNDASVPCAELSGADRILADVPCSGLGILAKKPDLRYKRLNDADLNELTALQARILENAAVSLAPGGRLVYSTCTINPAENEQQIESFLERHPEFSVCMPAGCFPPGMAVGPFGALSVPTRTEMDGFFISVMQKDSAAQ